MLEPQGGIVLLFGSGPSIRLVLGFLRPESQGFAKPVMSVGQRLGIFRVARLFVMEFPESFDSRGVLLNRMVAFLEQAINITQFGVNRGVVGSNQRIVFVPRWQKLRVEIFRLFQQLLAELFELGDISHFPCLLPASRRISFRPPQSGPTSDFPRRVLFLR